VQGAAIDTLPLCSAACDLRDECMAFSHITESTGGICKLHGTMHEGLILHFEMFGEFAHHNGTEQARRWPKPILSTLSTKEPRSVSCSSSPFRVCVAGNPEACLQAMELNSNAVCMLKLVRRIPHAATATASSCEPCVRSLQRPLRHRWHRRQDRWRHRRRHRPRKRTRG
jgi:hypothetical protein